MVGSVLTQTRLPSTITSYLRGERHGERNVSNRRRKQKGGSPKCPLSETEKKTSIVTRNSKRPYLAKNAESQMGILGGRNATLSDIEKFVPLYKEHLSEKLNWEGICPKCKSRLFWGIPSAGQREAAEKGKLMLCGQKLRDKNYCPNCKTVVFTKKETIERWSNLGG